MKREHAEEVIACLPAGRTFFHYSKDDYAFLLLHFLSRQEKQISKLRKSPAARLLEKPAVKPHLARFDQGLIEPSQFPKQQALRSGYQYLLTLDIWGNHSMKSRDWHWLQVSRKGVSLVLQLNLNQSHDRKLSKIYERETNYDPFATEWHPTRSGKNPTLSWCRLDLDLENEEVLIEEIQTDLVRDFRFVSSEAKIADQAGEDTFRCYGSTFHTQRTLNYWERDFSKHEKIWHEATLSAAIDFIVNELGLRKIFYHTVESGKMLKRIEGSGPPTSLYTKLPKLFCFDRTNELPQMLKRSSRSRKAQLRNSDLEFYRLELR